MKQASSFQPSDAARTANLMAHPAAGVMALTAIGFGMAGQAMGVWIGSMAVAGDASRRFWQPLIDADVASDAVAQDEDVDANEHKATVSTSEAVEAPGAANDLKSISGIGPKIEQVLNGLGVHSYAQIAAWNDDDIASFEEHLGFSGRIGRDDWVGQAAALLTQAKQTAKGAGGN